LKHTSFFYLYFTEIEVLHDQLLEMFAEDHGLLPKDILAMAPDIETYTPLIEAVFGAGNGESFPAGRGGCGDGPPLDHRGGGQMGDRYRRQRNGGTPLVSRRHLAGRLGSSATSAEGNQLFIRAVSRRIERSSGLRETLWDSK
jgi:hypothetical protein